MRMRCFLLLATLAACAGTDDPAGDDGGSSTDGTPGADGTDGADGTSGGDGADGTSDGADGTEDTGSPDPLQQPCESGEDGTVGEVALREFSSTVTWTVDYDATAEAAGGEDCSYTRTYTGTEQQGFEHLCPDCEAVFRGTAVMDPLGTDCYASLIGSTEFSLERTEWWGVSEGGRLFRTGRDQGVLGELATFSGGEGDTLPVGWDSEGDAAMGGAYAFTAAGSILWTPGTTTAPDFWGPRAAPYACGWECSDPGDLGGDFELSEGGVLPNTRLLDQCGEWVDLHDFAGSYVVVDLSQFDCPPCRNMAEQEEDFLEDMREAGIPVRVLTLMGNGLSDPRGTPDSSTVDAWVSTYGLTDPVLYDRGYGMAVLASYIEEAAGSSLGFPAWAVFNPDLQAIGGGIGFSSWDSVEAIIVDDRD